MLLSDEQTNQRYQKHNLLCQGGNNKTLSIDGNMRQFMVVDPL